MPYITIPWHLYVHVLCVNDNIFNVKHGQQVEHNLFCYMHKCYTGM